jgi:hypothetical protein
MRVSCYPSSGKVICQFVLDLPEVRRLLGDVTDPSRHYVTIAGSWPGNITLTADGTEPRLPDRQQPGRRLKFMRVQGRKERYTLQWRSDALGFPGLLFEAFKPDWSMEGQQIHIVLPAHLEPRDLKIRMPTRVSQQGKTPLPPRPEPKKVRTTQESFRLQAESSPEARFEEVFASDQPETDISQANKLVGMLNAFLIAHPDIYAQTDKGPTKRIKLVKLVYLDL